MIFVRTNMASVATKNALSIFQAVAMCLGTEIFSYSEVIFYHQSIYS
jgi:hypothetical protein